MTPQRYRKKPVEIEAWQISKRDDPDAIAVWCGGKVVPKPGQNYTGGPLVIAIETLEGTMHAEPGDYVIKGVAGEFYPCKPSIFAATYDPAADDVDVRWSSSELTTYDAESETHPGVFLVCRGDDPEDVRAVLRVEHAVAEDGAEVARPLAARLACLLNQQHVEPLPGETE